MMSGMHEFLGKLWSMEFGIALLGALVGGGFTLLGSWFQTKSANKAAELIQAKANAQRCFDALTQLKVLLEIQTFAGMGSKDTRAAWNRERERLVTTANSAIMLLPDEHKDTRLRVMWLLSKIEVWYGLPAWPEYKLKTSLLLSEALKVLALFVRGSDAPERRNIDQVITQKIEDWTTRTLCGSTSFTAFWTSHVLRSRRPRARHPRHDVGETRYLLSLTNDRIIEHSRTSMFSCRPRRHWRTGAFRMPGGLQWRTNSG
jgi:hypothetical protein